MTEILSGSWRAEPGAAEVSEASLAAALPVVTGTGASGLAWNRVKRNEDLRETGPAQELRQHARMLALDVARQEAGLSALFRLMQGAGVAPLLFKGCAVAQHYGAPHLRAMGDVDLCAPPGRFDELAELFAREGFVEIARVSGEAHGRAVMLAAPVGWPSHDLLIDLHERFDSFSIDSLEDVFSRAGEMRIEGAAVRAPALEDHLRIAAIHFLRDGGWRPSSLCDVGAMLESLPATFDWDLCLGAHPRRRRWIAASFELAHVLVGARLETMPTECRFRDLPPWLGATVLGAWEKPVSWYLPRAPFRATMRRGPARVPAEIRARWPNGIRASLELGADVSRLPRWPYQLLCFVKTVGGFASRGLPAGALR